MYPHYELIILEKVFTRFERYHIHGLAEHNKQIDGVYEPDGCSLACFKQIKRWIAAREIVTREEHDAIATLLLQTSYCLRHLFVHADARNGHIYSSCILAVMVLSLAVKSILGYLGEPVFTIIGTPRVSCVILKRRL